MKQKKKQYILMILLVAMLLTIVPINVFAEEYSATVTFIKTTGGIADETVTITNPDEILGNRGLSNELFPKSYFIGWSDSPNFGKDHTAKFYQRTAKVSDVLPNGSVENVKLYSVYFSISDSQLANVDNIVDLNKELTGEETVINTLIDTQPSLEPQIDRYTKAVVDKKEFYDLDATSNFKMNPKVAVAIYNDPWVGALDNGSSWGTLNQNEPHATYIDLHIILDERLEISDTLTSVFKSYNFRPISVLSILNTDGTPVADGENRPILASFDYMKNQVQKSNPETKFTFNTFLTDDKGEKVQLYEFVLRCRTRVGYDLGLYPTHDKIPATPEQIMSDMTWNFLQDDNSYARIKSDDAKKIANGLKEPIMIEGAVKGKAKTPQYCYGPICIGGPVIIGPIESNKVIIDFRMPLNKIVTFDKNTAQYNDMGEQLYHL